MHDGGLCCSCSWHRTDSTGADALHMPASRGITGPLTVRQSTLGALCLQVLPRGSVHFDHALSGLREESDGVTLRFQVRTCATAEAASRHLACMHWEHRGLYRHKDARTVEDCGTAFGSVGFIHVRPCCMAMRRTARR